MEYERREQANGHGYQKHGMDPERSERREKRLPPDPREDRTARLLRKDYSSLLKYFLKDSIYFVMKSSNYENIQISMDRGVWSTPPQNEQKLSQAFHKYRNVILIFSAKESGRFAGFARLSSDLIPNPDPPVNWILPASLAGKNKTFTAVFEVDWISRKELPFIMTSHLFNPLNEGKPVKIARDGQEIDERIGRELVNLFPRDEEIQMIPLLKRMKKQTLNRIRQQQLLTTQHQQEQDDRLLPRRTGADARRPPHHSLRVVVHNNLHSSPGDHHRDSRKVQMPAFPSSGRRPQPPTSRPHARGSLPDESIDIS